MNTIRHENGAIEYQNAIIPKRSRISFPNGNGKVSINNGSDQPVTISEIICNGMKCKKCEEIMKFDLSNRMYTCSKCGFKLVGV